MSFRARPRHTGMTTKQTHPPQKAGRREWLGLAVLTLPCLLIAMDASVLNLAAPAISANLHPSSTALLWILDTYGFLLAGSLITMGALGDRIGRRKLLLIGAAAFGGASLLAAGAQSTATLIASRAILGVAGATLMPSTLGLIRTLFADQRQRASAIGVWGASLALGGAIGPLVGGALIELSSWHTVFLPAVPVMAALLLLGPRILPEARNPQPGPLDPASAVLSLTTILAVVFALKRVAVDGPSMLAFVSVALGVALGVLFIRRQARLEHPLFDLGLFARPGFSAALAANALGFALIAGTGLLIGQDLQLIHGLTPVKAGLCMTPMFAAFIVGDLLAAAFVKRASQRTVIATGLAIASTGLLTLTQAADGGLTVLIAGTVVLALGLASVFSVASNVALEAAPLERASGAAALSETSTELGYALGVAILGSIAAAIYRSQVHLTGARQTLGAAVTNTDHGVAEIARHAFEHSLSVTFALGGGVALLGALAIGGMLAIGAQTARQALAA